MPIAAPSRESIHRGSRMPQVQREQRVRIGWGSPKGCVMFRVRVLKFKCDLGSSTGTGGSLTLFLGRETAIAQKRP